jgi:hypothetical protein
VTIDREPWIVTLSVDGFLIELQKLQAVLGIAPPPSAAIRGDWARLRADQPGLILANANAMNTNKMTTNDLSGKVGWLLLWLLGIPLPILLLLFVLRGCT